MLALSLSGKEDETSPGEGCNPSDYFFPTSPAQTPDAPRQTREQPDPTSLHYFFAREMTRRRGPPPFHQANRDSTKCYTLRIMYARKLQAELVIGNERRPAPLDWLDSFCMRNFTGSAEFDDTLPTAEGRLEVGLAVDPERLAQAMSEWFTKRGKGNGQPVTIELREVDSSK
jgi:hypothetical protein